MFLSNLYSPDWISWEDDNDFEHIMLSAIQKAGTVPYDPGKLTHMAWELLESRGYVTTEYDEYNMSHHVVKRKDFAAAAYFIAKKARAAYEQKSCLLSEDK